MRKTSIFEVLAEKLRKNIKDHSIDHPKNIALKKYLKQNNIDLAYLKKYLGTDRMLNKVLFSLSSSSASGGGSSYNGETALVPNFSTITLKSGDMVTGGYLKSVVFYSSIPQMDYHILMAASSSLYIPLKFLTPTAKFTMGNAAYYCILFSCFNNASFNGMTSAHPPSTLGVCQHWGATSGIVFICNSSMAMIDVYKSSTLFKSVTLTGATINNYFSFACDGLNYWCGFSTTSNNPVFTWTKICSITDIPNTNNLNCIIDAFKTTNTLQSTDTLNLAFTYDQALYYGNN